ncbi:tetratricopeptide repeat protein [Haloferula sp.]|uniref:tetratricopeptide repeat protein n=1 Tax=Haloferula sp. TaxID=2497595 RepID=UPI00329E34DD
MRWLMILSGVLWSCVSSLAEDEKVPGVEAVISDRLAELPAPESPQVGKGVAMAVTTSDPAAQGDVLNGLVCLHGGWDFEAYRHFCEALKKDPACLMAHVGVLLSLLQSDLDLADEKSAALDRLIALVEEGVGSELEQRYAFGLVKLMRDGPGEAASAFNVMVSDFPNDPQAVLFKSLLGRGGYDDLGDATPDQVRAEEELRVVVTKHADVPYLLYGLLAIRAEAPTLKSDLPLARKLVRLAPEFPPYQHLLGHYEWRCGNHTEAHTAFAKAADLYFKWMESTGVDATRCPGWTKAECYRAVALASKGEYETALAVAEAVGRIEVTPEMAATEGGRLLLWEGKSLAVRILIRRSAAGDLERALKMLPPKKDAVGYGKKSLVVWSYQAYSSILIGRISLENEKVDDARAVAENLSEIGGRFVQTRDIAAATGERSPWLRSFKAMEVMASELRGLITMAGPADDIGSAFNWYRSAADRQKLATLMMPPAVLLPMEVRLGEYYMARHDWNRAIETMIGGQHRWPNDWELLHQLQIAFHKAGMKADAADVEKRLEKMGVE